MIGRDADMVAARLSIHLRRNEFEACHNILDDLETAWKLDTKGIVYIAELSIGVRLVNFLEKVGYIKVSDLDDVNWESLRKEVPWLGPAGVAEVRFAVEAARVQIKLRKEVDKAEEEAELYMQAYEQ